MLPNNEAVLVAYSGGKDSLVVMDLCLKARKRVVAYMMVFLPGMDYYASRRALAEKRWGVEVREYLHWNTTFFLRQGIFRPEPDLTVPALRLRDVEATVRKDTGLNWIGYGYRSVDSLQRRAMLHRDFPNGICEKWGRFAPIHDWTQTQVLAYLSRARIPQPAESKRKVFGMSLLPECLAWLRRDWPEDYKRVLKVFPLASAQADRA